MPTAAPMTAEELLRLNVQDKRTELVKGRLVVRKPAGPPHGRVAMRIAVAISNHVYRHELGETFAAETGFTLRRNPDTVRAADAAFIATDRLPPSETRGFPELAPDLVVEVLSPDDRPGEVLAKVADWLTAGCRLVWVIDPVRRSGCAYRADGSVALLSDHDHLDGEDVLPGFTSLMASILT